MATPYAAYRRPVEIRQTLMETPLGVDPQVVEIVVGDGADIAALTETDIAIRGKLAKDGASGMRGRRLHGETCMNPDPEGVSSLMRLTGHRQPSPF